MEGMINTSAADPKDMPVTGRWEPVNYRCGFNPIHVALLHTGKVLSFGGSCNNDELLKTPRPAELWDPETNECELIEQDLAGDVFCVGHAFLPDGRLLIAGGTADYDKPRHIFKWNFSFPPFSGLDHTYIFDPMTKRWTRGDNLAHARWYPTLVMLGDGRVIAVAGLTRRFPWAALRKIEIYSPGTGWQVLKGADRWMPLYPRLHLLPDGRIFYSGSYNTHYTFPFELKQFPTSILDPDTGKWDGLGLPNQSEREEGTTVLLPLHPPDYRPRVLLI
jgi:WD40 repeat protein